MQKTALLFFLMLLQVNLLVPMEQEKNLKRNSIEQLQQNVKKLCLEQPDDNYFKKVPAEIVKEIITFCFDQKKSLEENVKTLLEIPLVCKQFKKVVEDYKEVRDFFVGNKVKLPFVNGNFIKSNASKSNLLNFILKFSVKDDFKKILKPSFADLLVSCIENNRIDLITLAIERGADINSLATSSYTVLYLACLNSNNEMVRFLIEKGADVNKKSSGGNVPLMGAIAAQKDSTEKVTSLLEKKANVDEQDEKLDTPLLYACKCGSIEVVKKLIDHGADINWPIQA